MKSYVTTKKGDTGKTRALNGTVYDKDHPMMEAVGALDAMRAHIALLRAHILEQRPDAVQETEFLLFLLHTCFLIGSDLSDPLNEKPDWHKARLEQRHLDALEEEQARLEATLKLPAAFIVCATNPLAAQADVAATMVRAFERRLVAFQKAFPEFHHTLHSAYVNRLSDYLFILGRHLEHGEHQPVNYALVEIQ